MSGEVSPDAIEAARGYEGLFVPALFQTWTRHLVAGARIAPGARVLDVACGTGVLARHAYAATTPAGHVAGLDAAPGMIAVARETEPAINWVVGPAESLPFGDGAFDAVLSQFGMMFFTDLDAAIAEMVRVLTPGGHIAVAVWNTVEENPAYRDVAALLDEAVGREAGDAVRVPFCLGDPREVETRLATAGLDAIDCATLAEHAQFPAPRTMAEAEMRGWLPLFDIHLDEDTIAEVLARADVALAPYATDGGEAVFPTSAHIFTATKPR